MDAREEPEGMPGGPGTGERAMETEGMPGGPGPGGRANGPGTGERARSVALLAFLLALPWPPWNSIELA